MKTIIKVTIATGVALLFSGCAGSNASMKTPPLNMQPKGVAINNGHYYSGPMQSSVEWMDAKTAYLNGITSSGLLQCKKNYGFVANPKAGTESEKVNKAYLETLSDKEMKTFISHPTAIPKQEGKEFQKIIKVETKLVKQNQITCIPPMSKKEVREYKAYIKKYARQQKEYRRQQKEYRKQQAKINNDPRVIAARANERAARLNAQAASNYRSAQANANQSTSAGNPGMDFMNAQLSQQSNTSNTVYSPSRTRTNSTTYLHSNGQTTRKIGNTYLHSDGSTTIGM